MPKKTLGEDSLVAREGGPVKMSIVMTQSLLNRIREVQGRQGIDNFSNFMRLFLRKYLPSEEGTQAPLEGQIGDLLISTDDQLGQVLLETAGQLDMTPAGLARQILVECLGTWVQKAQERQEVIQSLQDSLRGPRKP